MNVDLEVKKSNIHGQGLFAKKPLPGRRKIGELGGELIKLREARRRARGAPCIAIVEFADGTALDASRGAKNDFRFMNHSCAPNTFMRLFRQRVEFYTLRPIKAGEELTCNYGETQHEGKLPCQCPAEKCRQRL